MVDRKCKICKGQLIGRADKQTCGPTCRAKLSKLNSQKAYNKLLCELIAN
jgi:hypothetical protein